MHHIIEEQVRTSPAISTSDKSGSEPEKVDVTLVVPAALPLQEVTAMRDVLESLRGSRLLTTVPTPTAAVISYLSSRVQLIDREMYPTQHYVVLDVGSHTTEVSIVESQIKAAEDPKTADISDVSVRVTSTASLPIGGAHITEAIIRNYVVPQIPDWENYGAKNLRLQNSIFQAVEKAKTSLAANTDIRIHVEDVTSSGDQLSMILTRDQLASCVQEVFSEELLEEAFGPIRAEIEDLKDSYSELFLAAMESRSTQDAQESPSDSEDSEDFDDLQESFSDEPAAPTAPTAPAYPLFLFYGGSSRVLAVQALLERFFNATVQKYVNVEEGAIFGASLVAARHGSGFKLANRFMPSDYTRPQLFYLPHGEQAGGQVDQGVEQGVEQGAVPERETPDGAVEGQPLFHLNPYIRKSIQNDLFPYDAGEFYLANDSFGITYQNESKVLKEENGTNKTVTSMAYNTETVNVTYLRTRTEPFYSFEMAVPGNFKTVCNFSMPPSKAKELREKANRRGTVKWRHVRQAKEEAQKVDKANEELLAILEARVTDPKLQEDYKLKMIVNVTTDGVSLPTVDFAGIQVQNWTAINQEREQEQEKSEKGLDSNKKSSKGGKADKKKKDEDNAKKAELTVLDIPFEVTCDTVFSPDFQMDPDEFHNNIHFLKKCEIIKETRAEYEEKLNSIESYVYASRDILETYPIAADEDGDFVLYPSEAQSLRDMSRTAEQSLEQVSSAAPCGADIHCVHQRLDGVDSVLSRFERVIDPITERIKQEKCRPRSLEKLESGLADLEALAADAKSYLGPTLAPLNESEESDWDDAREPRHDFGPDERGDNASDAPSDGPADPAHSSPSSPNSHEHQQEHQQEHQEPQVEAPSTQPVEVEEEPLELSPEAQSLVDTLKTCEALEDIDVNALMEQHKQSQTELKAEKAESDRKKAETSWLKKLFSSETRKEEKRLKLMEDELFYSRAMLKKIKKASSDCSYIESQHSKMVKAYRDVEKQLNRTREKLADVAAEFPHRPLTSCNELDDLAGQNSEEVQRLQRFMKEVRTTIENGKIDKLRDSLQKSSLKIRDGIQRIQSLAELLGHGTRAEIVQELARNFDIRAAANKMDEAVSRFLVEQKALIEEFSRVGTETYADLERRVKDWFAEQLKEDDVQDGAQSVDDPEVESPRPAEDSRQPGADSAAGEGKDEL